MRAGRLICILRASESAPAVLEEIKWQRVTKDLALNIERGAKVIVMRGDGKLYGGVVVERHAGFIMLENGSQRQMVDFHSYNFHLATLKGPRLRAPRLADRQLKLDNPNGE